eukprot:15192932-Alexandrium_andersonii.AAC.1
MSCCQRLLASRRVAPNALGHAARASPSGTSGALHGGAPMRMPCSHGLFRDPEFGGRIGDCWRATTAE